MARWAVLLAIVPAMLFAQAPKPRPWFLDAEVVRDLNLSNDQIRQIRQTQKENRARMLELRATAEKAESDLEAAFNEDPVDQNKANDAINRIANTRGELTKAVSQMELKFRTILTIQQWQELQKRQMNRPGPHRRAPNQGGSTTPSGAILQK
jgi:Spy/CpxP family protein refolding chaperone